MNIKHLLTALTYAGKYADLPGTWYTVPRTPPNWEPLLKEFITQLHNPATPLYDDRNGTTGPRARERVNQANVLCQELSKIADTLSLVTTSEPIPALMDQHDYSVDMAACTNPRINTLLKCRPNAEPMVQSMIDLYRSIENQHKTNQQLTTVNPSPAPRTPKLTIEPHDNATFSGDSDCESYHGDPEEDTQKFFTAEELDVFDDVYLHIAEELSQRYQGVSLLEAQVVVQAYCLLRKLPMGVRASKAAFRLAFDSKNTFL